MRTVEPDSGRLALPAQALTDGLTRARATLTGGRSNRAAGVPAFPAQALTGGLARVRATLTGGRSNRAAGDSGCRRKRSRADWRASGQRSRADGRTGRRESRPSRRKRSRADWRAPGQRSRADGRTGRRESRPSRRKRSRADWRAPGQRESVHTRARDRDLDSGCPLGAARVRVACARRRGMDGRRKLPENLHQRTSRKPRLTCRFSGNTNGFQVSTIRSTRTSRTEPPRVSRRVNCLSQAAIADSCS